MTILNKYIAEMCNKADSFMLDHTDKNDDNPTTPGALKVMQKPLWH